MSSRVPDCNGDEIVIGDIVIAANKRDGRREYVVFGIGDKAMLNLRRINGIFEGSTMKLASYRLRKLGPEELI